MDEPTKVAPGACAPAGRDKRGGFSLVELVVAVIILAVGVLGLAGTTALVVRQVSMADVNTERSAAFQAAIEQIRAMPYANVSTGSRTVGSFSVTWSVVDSTIHTKTVRVLTNGPGLAAAPGGGLPTMMPNVQDTFSFLVLRP